LISDFSQHFTAACLQLSLHLPLKEVFDLAVYETQGELFYKAENAFTQQFPQVPFHISKASSSA
jgi:hypothetical protein